MDAAQRRGQVPIFDQKGVVCLPLQRRLGRVGAIRVSAVGAVIGLGYLVEEDGELGWPGQEGRVAAWEVEDR